MGELFFSPPWWAWFLVGVTILLFCRLGMWQEGRAAEKMQIAARYAQRALMPAQDLRSLLKRGEDVEDYTLELQGHYDNKYTIYQDQNQQGRAGFQVYTVFWPEGSAAAILVNRGWIAVGRDMQKLPAILPANAPKVVGHVAMPSPYFTVGEPDYQKRPLRVNRLDLQKVSSALNIPLQPFFLRLESATLDGLQRHWSPSLRLGMSPEKHRAYAFQWFSLAVAVLIVFIAVNIKKKESYEPIS